MDQYIKTVLICSVITGILDTILPGESIKRHLRFLSSCIMLLVLLSPLLDLFPSVERIEYGVEDFLAKIEEAEQNGRAEGEALIQSYGEDAVAAYIKEELEAEFSISDDEIEVIFEKVDTETLVHVILRGKASWTDGERVTIFLKEKLNCRVKVTRK